MGLAWHRPGWLTPVHWGAVTEPVIRQAAGSDLAALTGLRREQAAKLAGHTVSPA